MTTTGTWLPTSVRDAAMNELLTEFQSRYWGPLMMANRAQAQEYWLEFLEDAYQEFRSQVHEL